MQKTIKTIKSTARQPLISFILSLLFTGLGQMYNGNILKGIAFLSLRTIPLLIIPLYINLKIMDSYMPVYIFLIVSALIISIISPVESLYCSIKTKNILIKKYNSLFIYIAFAIITLLFLTLNILSIKNTFKIFHISNNRSIPLLNKGSYVLIKRLNLQGFKRGELVQVDMNNTCGFQRIIARGKNTVEIQGGKFFVNGLQLIQGIFSDSEMKSLAVDTSDEILSETNGDFKYPILIDLSKNKSLKITQKIEIKKGEILLALDNRKGQWFYSIVKENSVAGRVEGIFFSNNGRKIFTYPFIKVK